MRAKLRALVELALKSSTELPQLGLDPSTCPNCGTPTADPKSPFCSFPCREEAAFVRQFRASLANDVLEDPGRQLALSQKFWSLLGGGFPYRQSLIPPKTIAKVIERDGFVCSVCGAPATEVDHRGTG